MNKATFAAMMISWTLTMAGLAPAFAAPEAPVGPVREPERVVRIVRTPSPTWTCVHNTYRSVDCR